MLVRADHPGVLQVCLAAPRSRHAQRRICPPPTIFWAWTSSHLFFLALLKSRCWARQGQRRPPQGQVYLRSGRPHAVSTRTLRYVRRPHQFRDSLLPLRRWGWLTGGHTPSLPTVHRQRALLAILLILRRSLACAQAITTARLPCPWRARRSQRCCCLHCRQCCHST